MQLYRFVNTLEQPRTERRPGSTGGEWTYVVLGQETRAELQVVVKIERASSFKPGAKSSDSRSFSQLPHALHATELALGVLSGHLRASPGPAAVMVVGGGHLSSSIGMSEMLLVLLRVAVEEGRHCRGGWMDERWRKSVKEKLIERTREAEKGRIRKNTQTDRNRQMAIDI